MKRLSIFLACLLPVIAFAADRPNILMIYLDDYGWTDASFMGSDFYETPHLDKLAASGMVFTDAYAGAANCAPSRACLLSGQYSPRHEVFNVGTGPRGNSKYRKLKHIPGTSILRPDIKTWAACIKEAGYTTATMGKWHLSNDPLPYGFDVNVGGTHSGGPPKGYFPPHPKAPGLEEAPKNEYVTDRLSDEAISFITTNKEKNWLLYLTHFAVHTPIQAKKEDIAYFEKKERGEHHYHTTMAGMIKSVDDGVGKIVAALNDLGIKDNTAIFLYSDNGGYGPATSMKPLKGYKGTYYEGGIRVPFFVNWPGVVKPGTKSGVPIGAVDLYPTLCEMAGAKLPTQQPVDGVSLVPVFKGGDSLDRDALFWHFPAYLQSYSRTNEQRDPHFRSRPCSVIRMGDYKLHEYFEDGDLELYNVREDLGEANELSKSMPEKLQELHARLKQWRKKTKAPVPTELNPDYDPTGDQGEEKIKAKSGKKKKNKK